MKILCGIQPTGKLHIGNYLGCLKAAIELQDDNDVVFLVAQYHALTSGEEYKNTEAELRSLGAKNIVYQSADNTELMWKLLCKTSMRELERMTQYKQKNDLINNAGLFAYPVLMAADIFLSGCDQVLVGEDQLEHIEFANRLAKKTGHKQVAPLLTPSPRIMSIKDPTRKMSKSLGNEHCLFIGEDCTAKIRKAPTNEAGLKNLITIAKGLGLEFDTEDCLASKIRLAEKIRSL